MQFRMEETCCSIWDLKKMEQFPKNKYIVLKELGAWNKKHGEAIFNTLGGIPQGHFYGPTTLSKDSSCLYLVPARKYEWTDYDKGTCE